MPKESYPKRLSSVKTWRRIIEQLLYVYDCNIRDRTANVIMETGGTTFGIDEALTTDRFRKRASESFRLGWESDSNRPIYR